MQAMEKKKTSSDSASGDCMQSNDSDVLQAVSSIRRNYSTKLGQVFQSILMVIGNFTPWCSTLVYTKRNHWKLFLSLFLTCNNLSSFHLWGVVACILLSVYEN